MEHLRSSSGQKVLREVEHEDSGIFFIHYVYLNTYEKYQVRKKKDKV